MGETTPFRKLDESDVRTVVDLATHIAGLRDAATTLQGTFETRDRGYFTPSEDDQVLSLWVSYHKSRAALLELIDTVREHVGEATRKHAGEFAVAYGAALVLVDAARCLRDLFGENDLVRRKLNESYQAYGIEEGSFDAIQLSLTDPSNALAINDANEFYDDHRELLVSLAEDDGGLRAVLNVIENVGDSTRVSAARYVKARVKEVSRDTKDRIVFGSVARAIYAIQEFGSRLVSNISLRPNHVAALPDAIADEMIRRIQPGDIFVTRKDAAVTNYFLPGYWPHAAMYIGDRRVIESLKDGVHEREMDSPFGNDAVAVIRPKLDSQTVQEAIERARTHLGKPYDFDFDFTRSDRLVCTEVVYRSYEGLSGLRFELRRRAGRETLSAEDLLNLALLGQPFQQVAVFCPEFSDQILEGSDMTNVLRNTMEEPVA